MHDVKKDIVTLKEVNEEHQKRISELEERVNEAERYQRRWNLRLYGLAEQEGENVKQRVIDICRAVVPEAADNFPHHIEVVHRVGRKSAEKVRPVILRFTARSAKELLWKSAKGSEYLQSRKLRFGEDLTTKDKDRILVTSDRNAFRDVYFGSVSVYACLPWQPNPCHHRFLASASFFCCCVCSQYGIVLDAGSSHTAMFIYKWPADKQNGTGIVSQHSECHAKGGGISSYAGNKGGAASSLEECMEQAMQEIPKSRHKLTPLYLGATAGMRLLNISKPKESDEVLKEVAGKLKTYPFSFKGATILSGQEEGAYGWVTVNYLLENYIKYGFVGQWLSPGRDTVGALDFGGASTQITFETKQMVENKDNLMKLRLYGRDYQIYTQSFLCYGRDQVLLRLLALLMKTQGSDRSIVHPCYPAGYSDSIKLSSVFDTPCNKRQTPYKPDDDLQIKGTGNYDQCLGNVSRLFSFNNCSYSRCSFDGVFQPNITGNFMAFSAFFYTHSFLQEATGISITSPEHLEDATHVVCNMSFQEITNKVQGQESRLKDYCTVSAFVQVLLVNGYGFDFFSFPHISFQKKAGDTSVGWSLGFMLSLSNLLPAEDVLLRKSLRSGAWSALIILFCFLLIVALYFLLRAIRKKDTDNVI
ncbi:ectonucleoside triphosphate diphosphohydrolase 2-like [Sinocyclocheilus rhinocerous]|uniref:ectonucleoside triphosphate diphosphohydrolase 2-like n=1 Tax=Sinocyclocheilus rhinocerous TaxID=307959 RepID=UPI0007BA70C0|nr:PREDICTED: ectonucleoside triphosphate diphosphohydrolase 2-like [Sinocyclocheilus rhinocerous]